ncbi:MAG TPA: tRNA (N6-threonylcarbamoyladenosine(37)-N6)-methyltransferase TrmO [Dehalococcoidia bacterium]|nr:tRNA (N6-threonylcarbamoyladenosine(37)-N6)-methyltransferase TrmO [Dehalococcoidia bacterium]
MSLASRLRGLFTPGKDLIPREPVTYRPIGVVRNQVRESRPDGWENVRSDIILREDLALALDPIEGFSHVIVVFDFHFVPEAVRRLTIPVGNEEEPPERGVLATRSQLRPNPIGVSVAKVVHRRKSVLRVLGLDAINGTPVLDIKPYLPEYDAVPGATLPPWAIKPAQ